MHRLSQLCAAAGAATSLYFLLDAADLGRPERWIVLAAFAGWAMVPFAVVALVAQRVRVARRASALMLLASVLLTSVNAFLLHETFVTHLDAQSAIAFVFLPLYETMALAPFVWGALYLRGDARG